MAPITLTRPGVSLTLIAFDDGTGEKRIQMSNDSAAAFTVSGNGSTLTIANNVMFSGLDAQGKAGPNRPPLVVVNNGATFVMLNGSSIRDININSASGNGAIEVKNGGFFDMQGGTVRENKLSLGNSGVPADVCIQEAARFEISGSAEIGALILEAVNAASRASVAIGSNWLGRIDNLNLQKSPYKNSKFNDAIATWITPANPAQVVKPTPGYVGNFASDVSKIGILGKYFTQDSNNSPRQAFTSSQTLDSGGFLR